VYKNEAIHFEDSVRWQYPAIHTVV